MKNTVLLIAIAGFTTAAVAEDFILSIAGAPATVDATSGAVFTIDVIGDASVGTHMSGGGFSFGSGSNSMIEDIVWTPANWSAFNADGGYAGNGEYNNIVFGQLLSFPGTPECGSPALDSELGERIGSFQITLAEGSQGQLNLNLTEHQGDNVPFTFEVFEWLDGPPNGCPVTGRLGDHFNDSELGGNIIFNGASINVVPAPSSLALLGLGGLAASRRRR